MSDQVQFTYHIQPPGKASGKLTVSNKRVSFEITNISNPLLDLLKGLVNMIVEPNHLWEEENICWIDWFRDDSCTKWVLSTNNGTDLNIKVLGSDDIFDDSNVEVKLDATCDFMQFCKAIISELDTFLKEIGLLNYEQIWRKDEFPLTYFLILKKYLIEHGIWRPDNSDNTGNLSDEINLLEA